MRLSASSGSSPYPRGRKRHPPPPIPVTESVIRRRRRRQLPPMTKGAQLSSDDNMVIRIERVVHRDCCAEPEPSSIPEGLRQYLLSISASASARKTPSMASRRPSVERYSLSPNTTIGALKAMLRLRHQLGRDFILLQLHQGSYSRALYDEAKSLREYGVMDCDTLRMTSTHKFALHIYNASAADHPVVQQSPSINYRDDQFILVYPSIYDTIATLKKLIFENTGYPPHAQVLNPHSFDFHKKDDRTLESLGFNCSGEWQQIALVRTPTHPLPSTVLGEVY